MTRSLVLSRERLGGLLGYGLGFRQVFVEIALDFTDELRFKGLQQKTKGYVKMDFRFGDVDLAIYAGALKLKRVAVPLTLELIFGGQRLRGFLHVGFGLGHRQRVISDEYDIRHPDSPEGGGWRKQTHFERLRHSLYGWFSL